MEALQMLKYHYKANRLDFSQHVLVNQWMVMDDPEHPVGADRTGLQAENMRDAVAKVIEAVEREESMLAELI